MQPFNPCIMKVNKTMQAYAQKLMDYHQLTAVFANDNGEFFMQESNASNSVGGNKKRYTRIEAKAANTEDTTETKEL